MDAPGATSAGTAASSGETAPADLSAWPKLSLESDWPWWRGPSRNGIAVGSAPTNWSATENIAWKADVPGRGHASPVIVGDLVLLATAEESKQVQSVIAYDRKSGSERWTSKISEGGFPARIHGKNTHASPTVACDGERIYVTFFHHDSLQTSAIDMAGKPVWQRTVGKFRPKAYEYGYAASPLLYRDRVIVCGECDSDSYLVALDCATGEEVWNTPRTKTITFSTPTVARVGGRDQLLISGAQSIASYSPETGKEEWKATGTAAATCGTAVWDGDLIFASGGYPQSQTMAVRADGTEVWKNGQKCYEQSMLAAGGYLYALTGQGVLFCWRASDGQEMWKQRLKGPVSASPVMAGGNIYWSNELGTTYVFKATPERFELVAENVLGDESMASPAVAGGRLFLRVASNSGPRKETLYCLGK
ncbi:MAG: PQQ-binding-like beta-propeller repeat protein [Planctomycetaceae bacterium]|nr:PQQ-binding-like beta-propeller repeat protein [Planctomycetaceae bacterium]